MNLLIVGKIGMKRCETIKLIDKIDDRDSSIPIDCSFVCLTIMLFIKNIPKFKGDNQYKKF
ncbi:hypothetical protein AAA799B03_00131 [Marine Group I thaumarchaeote SCGC AAA799-B03]|uniref:Uncharacterized protein n=1 Tax=Marine Group I thaumarchaeote SCGC AAA799-B03 TaxID=1502289 RepID=A0A087S927_9ARCH|nr:hypothetical protein AAA799B03_00131 [Marine Group I thaumarchaeote SCGC AAA799-B03]